MQKCPQCGFANLDNRDFCLKCQATLRHDPELSKTPRLSSKGLNFLAGLGAPFTRLYVRVRQSFAVPLPEDLEHRFPFRAAFLSLAPGLGQLYNHQPKKLLYLLPTFAVTLTLAIHFITTPWWGNMFILSTVSVCMVSFSDALVTAARINGQSFSTRQVLAALTYPFFLLGAFGTLCAFMAWLQWPVFTTFHVRKSYMAPAIKKGNRICGEGISYLFRNPRPGDVVRYDPPGLRLEQRDNVFLLNPGNGWERVMAVGGETLTKRGDAFFVDGRPLSQAYYPLLTTALPDNFTITCPENAYILLFSSQPEDSGTLWQALGAPVAAPSIWGGQVIPTNWEDCCTVEMYETEAGLRRKAIFERAWFIYHPAEHRRFFQAKGPRFID